MQIRMLSVPVPIHKRVLHIIGELAAKPSGEKPDASSVSGTYLERQGQKLDKNIRPSPSDGGPEILKKDI